MKPTPAVIPLKENVLPVDRSFDSDAVNAIVKDIGLLKQLFKAKMESKVPAYLTLVTQGFNDKGVDNPIEHFRDKDRRKEFFKEYKEIEMLYEIISPDAFLRPFITNYTTLSSIYAVIRKAYAKTVYVDRAFQRKTTQLVQAHIDTAVMERGDQFAKLDREAIEAIKKSQEAKAVKVINLIKSIEKTAGENSQDPFLVAMAERARAVQENFEDRQNSTEEALAELLKQMERDELRKKDQAAKGLDGLTYFVLCKLTDNRIANPCHPSDVEQVGIVLNGGKFKLQRSASDRKVSDYVIVHEPLPLFGAASRQIMEKPDARAFKGI